MKDRLRFPISGLVMALAGLSPVGCARELPPIDVPPPTTAPPLTLPLPVAPDGVPGVRLPRDTHPVSEAITLTIDPAAARFSGVADIAIRLDHPRTTLWLHGKGFHVTRATAKADDGHELAATWAQHDESGMASLTLAGELPKGPATLHIDYDVAYGPKLEGLYKVTSGGVPYVFTQFESIAARDAFPCFDEPGFKIPWDETLVVPKGAVAIGNTHEERRLDDGPNVRVHFAQTLALPSYLVAFAVGPFDIVPAPDAPPNEVRKRPLPIRAITTKGRGHEVAYALAHTGEILATLEKYFGLEYPYDKLDILAVPDKGGAMENAGAVTFADYLVLFDPKVAPLRQKRAYAEVMAHELAHQWVGDLVTAAWWDDIWLNEAFATWVGTKATDLWDPKMNAAADLLSGIQGAMGEDALVSARSIRQPIESINDIENAFDSITYQKGGGVLSMFERWAGPEVFQRGLHDYLVKRSFGSGTAADFLDAESRATGKDVATPFQTFLDQPGVPFVEAEVVCSPGSARLHLRQSRYLPMGSSGDANKTWQIPVCARYQVGKDAKEACTLLDPREGELALGNACPDWVFPNANAAGYFRFSLAPADLVKLRQRGLASLTPGERVVYGNSIRAGFNRGTLPMKDAILATVPLATDPHKEVAGEAMGFLEVARDWLHDDALRPAIEAYGRNLFHPVFARLGWDAGKNEDADRAQLRARVIQFLAQAARDPIVRAEAKKRGLAFLGVGKDGAIHREALDANLVGVAMSVVGEDLDVAGWEAILAQLHKTDVAEVRWWLLAALCSATRPELLPRVRGLAFDPLLRTTEVTSPLWSELREPALREGAWGWVKDNFDKLLLAVPKHHGQSQILAMADEFCDEAHAKDAEAFFTPARVAQIDGGPRVLASTLESIRLCAAKKTAQEPSLRELFQKK